MIQKIETKKVLLHLDSEGINTSLFHGQEEFHGDVELFVEHIWDGAEHFNFLKNNCDSESLISNPFEGIETELRDHKISKKSKSYYQTKTGIIRHSSYPLDFHTVLLSGNKVKVYSDIQNLYTILSDFIEHNYDTLPVHSCSLSKKGKGFLFISDSGMGKTSLAYNLVKLKGFDYISSDQTFVQPKVFSNGEYGIILPKEVVDERLINGTGVTLNKFSIPVDKLLQFYGVKRGEIKEGLNVYYIVNEESTEHPLDFLKIKFPSIIRQSYWWHKSLGIDERVFVEKYKNSIEVIRNLDYEIIKIERPAIFSNETFLERIVNDL